MNRQASKSWRAIALVLCGMWGNFAHATPPTEGAWPLYALLPDGSQYRWRSDVFTKERKGVFRVWAQGDYAQPRPIPVKSGPVPDQLAHGVLVKQRVNCTKHELQTIYAGYFDKDEYFIREMENAMPIERPRPGTVGARLVASVCSTLVTGYKPLR